MSALRRLLVVPATAGTLALVLSLTGCFGNPVEQIIKQATGSDSGSSSLDENAAKKLAEDLIDKGLGEDGDFALERLPDGFPSEIDLYDGDVAMGMKMSDDGNHSWMVHIKAKKGDKEAYKSAQQKMENAGFEVTQSISTDFMEMTMYTNGTYQVSVSDALRDEDDHVIQYMVSNARED